MRTAPTGQARQQGICPSDDAKNMWSTPDLGTTNAFASDLSMVIMVE